MEDNNLSELETAVEERKKSLFYILKAMETCMPLKAKLNTDYRTLLQEILTLNDSLEAHMSESNGKPVNNTVVVWNHHRELARGSNLEYHFKFAIAQHTEFSNQVLRNIAWLHGALALASIQETVHGKEVA